MAEKMRRIVLLATAMAVSLALGAGSASAATVTCGQVITQSTTVDNDLIDCPGSFGLIIGADNVTLDLNGHMVDATTSYGYFSGAVGIDNSAGYDHVTIENGTIQEFGVGVFIGQFGTDPTGNVIRNVTVTGGEDGAIYLSNADHTLIDGVRASAVIGGPAIYLLDSSDNVISKSVTGSVTYSGDVTLVGTIGVAFSDHNVVEKTSVTNGGIGSLFSNDNLISRNTVVGGSIAADSTGNRIEKNSVTGWSEGITAAGTTVVADNDVFGTTGDGIRVSSGGVVVSGNRAYRNGDDGIDVDAAGATVTRNTANHNGDLGIEAIVAAGSVVDGGGNKASGNGNPAQCLGVTCK